MPILIFSPVYLFMGHPLKQNETSKYWALNCLTKTGVQAGYFCKVTSLWYDKYSVLYLHKHKKQSFLGPFVEQNCCNDSAELQYSTSIQGAALAILNSCFYG